MENSLVEHLLYALDSVPEEEIGSCYRDTISQDLLKCSSDADLRKTIKLTDENYMESICKHLNDAGKKAMDCLFKPENQEGAECSSDSKGEADTEKKTNSKELFKATYTVKCHKPIGECAGERILADDSSQNQQEPVVIKHQYPSSEWRDLLKKMSESCQELRDRLHKAEEQLKTPETRIKYLPRQEIKFPTLKIGFQHTSTKEQHINVRYRKRRDKPLDAVLEPINSQTQKDTSQKAKTETEIRDGSGDNDNKQLPAKHREPGSGIKTPRTKKVKSQTQPQNMQTRNDYREEGDWDFKVILKKLEEHLEAQDNALKRCEISGQELNSKLSAANFKSREEEARNKELTERVELMSKDRDVANERINKLEDERNKELEKNKNITEAFEKEMKKNKRLEAEIDFQVKKNVEDKKIMKNQLDALKKEKDDYRDRFSKMAGARLTENNADIADLSDPNRAMKLAEKFSTLYDDEWTDAFQDLCKHKIPKKNVLQLLLKILTSCYDLCEQIATQQLDTLSGNLVFPVKGKVTKEQEDFKGSSQLDPKHVKILREARRQLWEVSIGVIKQQVVDQTKDLLDKDLSKAFNDVTPYTEKCAEICWLMVIHEPPVFMKTETPSDDKMDLSTYTAYSASGQKIDFLVWPPLYNGKGGGLLSKGVLELIKTGTKDKKK